MKRYPIKTKDTACRTLDDEAIVENFRNSFFYNFNPVGAFIWERCDGQHTVKQISSDVAREFEITPEEAAQDSLEFIEGLVTEGLLEWQDGPSPPVKGNVS